MSKRQLTEQRELRREEPKLNNRELARREEALIYIIKFGDPALKSCATQVRLFDDNLFNNAQRMEAIMKEATGVGLAANQIGLLIRLLVFRSSEGAASETLVNPIIKWASDETTTFEEGCLSLPQVIVPVNRPEKILVDAQNCSGEKLEIEASGFRARVIQHEIDHLNGILIIDRTTSSQRKEAMKLLRGF